MTYHRPPDDYRPPTHCGQCRQVIIYGPVIGGAKWMHIGRAEHEVAMRPEGWWDTSDGVTRYGVADARLDAALAAGGAGAQGMTPANTITCRR